MNIQKSYNQESTTGTLYLVGTPIGNLSDITYRAVQILSEVDLIAAEDTRQTIKLLNHYQINKRLVSYHEHNKATSGTELLKKLNEGFSIALVSDAGMPAISDPGYELVYQAIAEGITVVPIPGSNAAITGLIASGLPTKSFTFIGFLPRQKKDLLKELEKYQESAETLIFYEAPHRIIKTLTVINETLGNRNIVIVRELTKKHEEFIRGTVEEVLSYLQEVTIKGELTLIIEGFSAKSEENKEQWWQLLTVSEHVEFYIAKGMSVKEAIKLTSTERAVQKREVYQEYHNV